MLALAQRSEPRLRATQVNDVVQRMWETVGERSVTPGVEVILDLAPELPMVWADADQLQQVFLNLYVNAMQAVGNVGKVMVSTRFAPRGGILSGASVEVMVADTGPGIAPQDIPRIFEPFFTTKNMAEGSGLGLAISQDIVLSHHGRIEVESTPGHGSRFTVALPPLDAHPASAQSVNHG